MVSIESVTLLDRKSFTLLGLSDESCEEICILGDDFLDLLKREEYVKMKVKTKYGTIDVVHGFPGDNPFGIVHDCGKLVAKFGEGYGTELIIVNKDNTDIVKGAMEMHKWYVEITKSLCDYGKFQSLYMDFSEFDELEKKEEEEYDKIFEELNAELEAEEREEEEKEKLKRLETKNKTI